MVGLFFLTKHSIDKGVYKMLIIEKYLIIGKNVLGQVQDIREVETIAGNKECDESMFELKLSFIKNYAQVEIKFLSKRELENEVTQ